jgi:hypothetical protein
LPNNYYCRTSTVVVDASKKKDNAPAKNGWDPAGARDEKQRREQRTTENLYKVNKLPCKSQLWERV